MDFIPYAKQWIDEDDIAAVVDVLRSDFLTTGPKIEEFENAFAQYTGVRYAVAIANGTAALHAACFAAGIGPGDEVITTPLTFAATANSVLYLGGIPVFADIDPETYNIDPKDIERKITTATKAIIAVHYAGQPCDMDAIKAIAAKHHLTVIEDAAHALGAEYKGRKAGTLGDMAAFSFHPVKHITTGEGGMVTTDNKEFYEVLKKFRSHGITRSADEFLHPGHADDAWYYEQQFLGYNYRMTDIQAALGTSQLKKADMFIERRRYLARHYREELQSIPGLILPESLPGTDPSWHLFILQVDFLDDNRKKEFFAFMQERGIGVNFHYIPVYRHPFYEKLNRDCFCPLSEMFMARAFTIPLYPAMQDAQQERVLQAIKEYMQTKREDYYV